MTAQRKNFIGGNWKCNGTRDQVNTLVEMLNKAEFLADKVDVVVAPPALYLDMVKSNLKPEVQACCQNVSRTGCGAFTGEIAVSQLKDFGIAWTLTGHSERRTLYGESDEDVATKTKLALDQGLKVIACIGETLAEREADKTLEVCVRQISAIAKAVDAADWNNIVIAYEPVWAIGTGVVATPEQAQEAHQQLRDWFRQNVSAEVADAIRIIYGGSVKGANCAELMALKDVDGFLVGGASLKPEFTTIIDSANN